MTEGVVGSNSGVSAWLISKLNRWTIYLRLDLLEAECGDIPLPDSATEVVDQRNQRTRSSENGLLSISSEIRTVSLSGSGLPATVMHPSFTTVVRFALLTVAVPAAFLFFSPFWNQVLVAETPDSNFGLYPFIATCFCVPCLSVWLEFWGRR